MKAINDVKKRPKSPSSPASSHGSSLHFSIKSSMNKDRPTSRNSRSRMYDRNFTEKSSHKGSFNRDTSFHSAKSKGSIDSRTSYGTRKIAKQTKPSRESLIQNMDESLNKIQNLSKRLNSLRGDSYGKHELFNNKKMTEKVNLYSRTSAKMCGRGEDVNPNHLKTKTLKGNSSSSNKSKTISEQMSFKKSSSPSKSISSVNSVQSMKKYSKDYFSPSSSFYH